MQHHGCPHTRTQVGRTLGQVTKLRIVRKVQGLTEQGVDTVSGLGSLFEGHAFPQHLDAQVILLVNHDGNALIL